MNRSKIQTQIIKNILQKNSSWDTNILFISSSRNIKLFLIEFCYTMTSVYHPKIISNFFLRFHVTTVFLISYRIMKRLLASSSTVQILSVRKTLVIVSGFRNIHVKSKVLTTINLNLEVFSLKEFCFLFLVVLNEVEIYKYVQFTVTTITTKTYLAKFEFFSFFAFCHLFVLRKNESFAGRCIKGFVC